MKSAKRIALGSALLVALWGTNAPAFAHGAELHVNSEINASKVAQTDAALRDLWVGHAFWVRSVVGETLAGNAAAASAAENGAVANAKQIAGAMEAYYGKAASEKVFGLLGGHYGAVKQYLAATVANSSEQQDGARKAMLDNAEQIAVFLSSANPNLPIDGLRGMLLAHGGHHVQQIQQLRAKQYAEEAQTWEAMKNHMYGIADALTGAIALQFPAKFK